MSNTPTIIRSVLLGIFFTGLAADILYFPSVSDLRYIILIFVWFIIVELLHFKSVITFFLVIGLLALLFIFYIFSRESGTNERIAAWIYLFLLFGVIQQMIELRRTSKTS